MRKKNIIIGIAAILILVIIFAAYSFTKYHVLPGNTEEITFKSGDIKLSGFLLKPESGNKFPAIVIMHGSGEETAGKMFYSLHAKEFRDNGFAVLIYDKRGCGNSEGNFEKASFNDLINDGIAAVNYLKSREDINPAKIGVMGNSESGWFTPEIAARVGDLSFIINRCGSPLSWIETNLHEIKYELLDADVPENEIPEILKLREHVWNYYIKEISDTNSLLNDEREKINAELKDVKNKYTKILSETLPAALPDYNTEFYKLLANDFSYNPEKYYQVLKTPMLCIFAEEDVNTPPIKSIERINEFNAKYSRNIKTKLFEGVGHNLFTIKGIFNGGYIPGYLELITDWAKGDIE